MTAHDSPVHSSKGYEDDHGQGHIGRPTYYRVFAGLMVLMILTVVAWYVQNNVFALPSWLAITIAMSIAIAKTSLIVLYFMHAKVSNRVTQLFAASAFVFLLILFIITMGDYVARGWPPEQGPLTAAPAEGWRSL